MVAWYFGESDEIPKVIKQLHSGEVPMFDLVWLVVWTCGGAFISFWMIWQLLGSEVVGVANGRLSLRKQVLGIGMTREFEISNIAALRFRPEHGSGKRYRGSCIELDYGAKTYRFGTGIDPAEASQLLDLVAKWVPTVRIERPVESEGPPSVQSLGLR